MENPVLPPYLKKKHSYPPPPAPTLDWMIQVIQSNPPPPFQNFVADVNKYFGIELPENNFLSELMLETICPDIISQPPPPPPLRIKRSPLSIDRKPDHTKIV